MLFKSISSAAKKMLVDFNGITSEIEHNGTKGGFREQVVRDFLGLYLPNILNISQGIVVDVDGNQSHQCDVLIYEGMFTPKFLFVDNVGAFPVESIRATVEVKSVLTTEELIKAIKDIENIRKLKKTYNNSFFINSPFPCGFIFAFKSQITLKKIIAVLSSEIHEPSNLPISIVCMDKGVVLNLPKENIASISPFPSKDTILGHKPSEDEGTNLMLFYLTMISALTLDYAYIRPYPNLLDYINKSGFINPTTHVEANNSEGTKVVLDNQIIDIDKIKNIQKNLANNKRALSEIEIRELFKDAIKPKNIDSMH